jgi:hypothetical protein
MKTHLRDEAVWAASLSARLRMLQASFADDEPANREGFLIEELDRALKEIPAGKKRSYLGALGERFPIPSAETQPAAAEPSPESPESLVARVVELVPHLSPNLQAALTEKLRETGLLPQPEQAVVAAPAEELPEELQNKLSMEPGRSLDRARSLKLIAVMLDFLVTVDQLVWNVWKNLDPNSVVHRDPGMGSDFRQSLGAYLSGDREVSTAQVNQAIDKTRQLTAGLLAAVGATGETFARQYLSRFSPANIKQLANTGPGFLVGSDQKCWRKYVELFEETSGVKIEQEIANAIVRYTEQLILGSERAK